MCVLIFFFFSSRRRHTRCGRDWSSDVCSSDLPDTDQETIAAIRSAIASRRDIAVEILNYRKNGAAFWNALFISPRSEEHTSELQSRPHLVCRLLLEKKKTVTRYTIVCPRHVVI